MLTLTKALDKLYRIDGEVITLGEYLATKRIVHRSASVGCKRLGNRNAYSLWFSDGYGFVVPRVVFDAYPALPVRLTYDGGSWGMLKDWPDRIRAEVLTDLGGTWPATWTEYVQP